MVRQDIQTVLARAAERTQHEQERQAREETEKTKARRGGNGWQVVAVQSIACVVILLLALLVRTAGGSAYEQLRRSFNDSMMSNDLLATLAVLWDGDPLDALSSDPLEEDGQTGAPTNGVTTATTTNPSSATTTNPSSATTTTTLQTTVNTTSTTAVGVSHTDSRLPPEGVLAVGLYVTHPAVSPLAEGKLTSGYGYRDNPIGEGEQFHRGVDIAAPTGAPIAAMFCGRVRAVGENDSLGRYVCLQHGNVEILYAHCAQVLANKDTVVRAGETVALVGATGDVTGSHLHVQVSVDGVVYNPSGIVSVAQYA